MVSMNHFVLRHQFGHQIFDLPLVEFPAGSIEGFDNLNYDF
jgi:hypothetical protein